MKTPALVLGIIFNILFIALACFTLTRANMGAGDSFPPSGLVQCTVLCLIVSIFFWRALFIEASKKRKGITNNR